MWQFLITMPMLVAVSAEVSVHQLDGKTISGQLLDLESDELSVVVGGDRKTVPRSKILFVVPQFRQSADPIKPPVTIELADGSRLVATAFSESQGTATVALVGREPLRMATKAIRWVRLNRPQAALNDQWNSIVARQSNSDVLVLRTSGESLDFFEGALNHVTHEAVRFTFDGDTVNVPRGRLEGFVYYAPKTDAYPDAICQVREVGGNLWEVSEVQWEDGKVRIATPSGVSIVLAWQQIEKLDYAGGNVVYLSDLEPLKVQWTPFLTSDAVSTKLARLYQPRRDRSFSGEKLRLRFPRGKVRVEDFDKGLALHSRSEVVYRLPDGFHRLIALAGIDDRAGDGGSVLLELSGDGRELLKTVITGQDQPLPIDVNVTGIRRLKILIDFADNLAIADQLDLCDLRITK